MKALVIIDMQYDFLEKGSLSVPNGESIIDFINEIQPRYDIVVATQDWHPANHKSFASQHEGHQVYDLVELGGLPQMLWPNHCVQGTPGAELDSRVSWNQVQAIFRKGMNPEIDSYSGFFDNGKLCDTGLGAYLKGLKVEEVHLCGLAADYCVYFSAMDALELGFRTVILNNGTQAINADDYKVKQKIFEEQGGICL